MPLPRQRSRRKAAAQDSRAPPAADAIRCFVALQPDDAARERLDALAGEQHRRLAPSRRMRRENLHLTLAFIGSLPLGIARRLAAQLALQPVEAFDWMLDEVGVFAGARVLWAGGSSPPLHALAERSRQLLERLAVPFDRKPFVPHVTLLRKLPREALRQAGGPIEPPIPWRVGAPVLLASISTAQGTRYLAVSPGND